MVFIVSLQVRLLDVLLPEGGGYVVLVRSRQTRPDIIMTLPPNCPRPYVVVLDATVPTSRDVCHSKMPKRLGTYQLQAQPYKRLPL